jgi:hypothetical protein
VGRARAARTCSSWRRGPRRQQQRPGAHLRAQRAVQSQQLQQQPCAPLQHLVKLLEVDAVEEHTVEAHEAGADLRRCWHLYYYTGLLQPSWLLAGYEVSMREG